MLSRCHDKMNKTESCESDYSEGTFWPSLFSKCIIPSSRFMITRLYSWFNPHMEETQQRNCIIL